MLSHNLITLNGYHLTSKTQIAMVDFQKTQGTMVLNLLSILEVAD